MYTVYTHINTYTLSDARKCGIYNWKGNKIIQFKKIYKKFQDLTFLQINKFIMKGVKGVKKVVTKNSGIQITLPFLRMHTSSLIPGWKKWCNGRHKTNTASMQEHEVCFMIVLIVLCVYFWRRPQSVIVPGPGSHNDWMCDVRKLEFPTWCERVRICACLWSVCVTVGVLSICNSGGSGKWAAGAVEDWIHLW